MVAIPCTTSHDQVPTEEDGSYPLTVILPAWDGATSFAIAIGGPANGGNEQFLETPDPRPSYTCVRRPKWYAQNSILIPAKSFAHEAVHLLSTYLYYQPGRIPPLLHQIYSTSKGHTKPLCLLPIQ